VDSKTVQHGFVRAPDGTFTSFDPTGSTGTQPQSINYYGAITGTYNCAGFVRAPNGTITSFHAGYCTTPLSINSSGAITGRYYAAGHRNAPHGFVRSPDGTITSFDPSASIATDPASINNKGVIAGSYYVITASFPNGVAQGFVRAPDGTITSSIAPPGTETTACESMNGLNVITGSTYYNASRGPSQGFVRGASGNFIVFNVPPFSGYHQTFTTSINDKGEIIGYYYDLPFVRGFVRTPNP
jgi:hypothetical protein